MTPALASICSSLGIEVVPTNERRGPRTTHAVVTMERLLSNYGSGHLVLVLRTIVETGHNANALAEPIIFAVSDVALAQPQWVASGLAWLEAFDSIDLVELWGHAKIGGTPGPRQTIAALIIDRLRPLFSEQRKVTAHVDA